MVFESYGRRAPASFPREAPDIAPEYNFAQAERTYSPRRSVLKGGLFWP
ncbi:hypothetical protein ME800_10000 [Lactobacillus delbrueckii]|nr:hypothetical protein ME800_10000 [Lactobacillus delbrueckii]